MVLLGKRVLVVDDNPINREVITGLLKEMGARTETAENGKDAVERFADSKPYQYDVILMDMQMPVLDGCSAVQKIRAMEREDAREIPIVAATGNEEAEAMKKCYESGMNDYLKKPFCKITLQKCIEKL